MSMDSLRHATADRLLSGRRLSKTAMTGAPIWRRSRKGRDSDMAAHPEASQDGSYRKSIAPLDCLFRPDETAVQKDTGRRRDACRGKLGRARDVALLEEFDGTVLLRRRRLGQGVMI